MMVSLASSHDSGLGQGMNSTVAKVESEFLVSVSSLQDAVIKCLDFIFEYDLDAQSWTGGNLYQDGILIAEISHNGKVWGLAPKRHEISLNQLKSQQESPLYL